MLNTSDTIKAKKLGLDPDRTTPAQLKEAIANKSKAKLKGKTDNDNNDNNLTINQLAELPEFADVDVNVADLVNALDYSDEGIPKADLPAIIELADELIRQKKQADHRIEKIKALDAITQGSVGEQLEMAAARGIARGDAINRIELNAYLNQRLAGAESFYRLDCCLDEKAHKKIEAEAERLGNGLDPSNLTKTLGDMATHRQKKATIKKQNLTHTEDWETILR